MFGEISRVKENTLLSEFFAEWKDVTLHPRPELRYQQLNHVDRAMIGHDDIRERRPDRGEGFFTGIAMQSIVDFALLCIRQIPKIRDDAIHFRGPMDLQSCIRSVVHEHLLLEKINYP
jgi:hypothetical protein